MFCCSLQGEADAMVQRFGRGDRLTLRGKRRLDCGRLSAGGWNAVLSGSALQEALPALQAVI